MVARHPCTFLLSCVGVLAMAACGGVNVTPPDFGNPDPGTETSPGDQAQVEAEVTGEVQDVVVDTGPQVCETDDDCDDDNLCTIDRCDTESMTCKWRPFCDDRNPCTDDQCDPDSGCTFVKNHADCDDGNPCNSGDKCDNGVCTPGLVDPCDDHNPCTHDSCDPDAGCSNTPVTGACDDGDACTTGETCQDGACIGGTGIVCDDAKVCTTDTCDPATGCVFTNNTAFCDDANDCTDNDTCSNGTCVGAQKDCNDGNACTLDECVTGGVCRHSPLEDQPCDDGNACTTGDYCTGGKCIGPTVVVCDDQNSCTVDKCLPASGCSFPPGQDGVVCSDGNACTVGDRCLDGNCTPRGPVDCDDENPCSQDSCDTVTGCGHTPLQDNIPCDDGNPCTSDDKCLSGKCKGVGLNCDDGEICTTDSCDTQSQQCTHTPNTLSCDDGTVCTDNDTCSAGQCAGTPVNCDDGNPCTDDGCNADSGCVHKPNTRPCDDGDPCTSGDTCADLACKGTAIVCASDDNPCTDDACQPGQGCTYPARTGKCDDGNTCTTHDTCQNKVCTGGAPLNCDDGDVCTDDSCDPVKGCVHKNNTAICADPYCDTSSNWVAPARCSAGLCVAGATTVCNDGNVCTTDSCDAGKGCLHAGNTETCSDGVDCTGPDTCDNGQCVSGPKYQCDVQPNPDCLGDGTCGCCTSTTRRYCTTCDKETANLCSESDDFIPKPVCMCGRTDACTDGHRCVSGKCECGKLGAPCTGLAPICCSCGKCAATLLGCKTVCGIGI